jgi:hypothetical protein
MTGGVALTAYVPIAGPVGMAALVPQSPPAPPNNGRALRTRSGSGVERETATVRAFNPLPGILRWAIGKRPDCIQCP